MRYLVCVFLVLFSCSQKKPPVYDKVTRNYLDGCWTRHDSNRILIFTQDSFEIAHFNERHDDFYVSARGTYDITSDTSIVLNFTYSTGMYQVYAKKENGVHNKISMSYKNFFELSNGDFEGMWYRKTNRRY